MKGGQRMTNTTSTMEMYNSTIMKIVVTQKKATNQDPSSGAASPSGSRRGIGSPRSPSGYGLGPIFGNSVMINGVTMQSQKQSSKGIIRVGRGVGITGKKQLHGTHSRQGTLGKLASSTKNPHISSRDQNQTTIASPR